MNPFFPLILIGGMLIQQPIVTAPPDCKKGEYRSMDGRCLHDQTGESHPYGDGCNTATCHDPACRFMSVTAMYCSHGDDPAPPPAVPYIGPPITSGHIDSAITVPFAVATTGDNPFPTMKCPKHLEHTLLIHDGRLYESQEEMNLLYSVQFMLWIASDFVEMNLPAWIFISLPAELSLIALIASTIFATRKRKYAAQKENPASR
jgi:hypothetical protein